uniref:Secreted protein n=1 Tax=Bursaphelenchus xylophilus TaxID=6326 RepID=A0A1I7RK27_BURXY
MRFPGQKGGRGQVLLSCFFTPKFAAAERFHGKVSVAPDLRPNAQRENRWGEMLRVHTEAKTYWAFSLFFLNSGLSQCVRLFTSKPGNVETRLVPRLEEHVRSVGNDGEDV